MNINEELKQFSSTILKRSESIQSEEATKMSLVVPFFRILGYDIFNPSEFCPEYTADVGIKKGEKVDYAILFNDEPQILIECKWCGEPLEKHGSQLFRYFATTTAKFGILTNGIIYRFYTDLDEANKMDLEPFLEIDMSNLRESHINELKKFSKENFDCDNIFNSASELKYTSMIKETLQNELDSPTDEFVKFMISGIYQGQKKQTIIDKFRPIVKKAFNSFITDTINNKISSALSMKEDISVPEEIINDIPEEIEPESKIVTTEEELMGYNIICSILSEYTDVSNIAYKDTESYFGILFQGNIRKTICRLNFDTKKKQLILPTDDKKYERIYLEDIRDLFKYKDSIITSLKNFL